MTKLLLYTFLQNCIEKAKSATEETANLQKKGTYPGILNASPFVEAPEATLPLTSIATMPMVS